MEFWFGNMKAEGGWVGPVAGQASGFRAFKLIQACKGCFGLTASKLWEHQGLWVVCGLEGIQHDRCSLLQAVLIHEDLDDLVAGLRRGR